jgi:bacterioferritin-associated ferredoxin
LTKGEKALKARIPVKLKREAMAEINRLADREYQKVKDKEIADATRRIFKTIVFALHKDFGFGRDRCAKALKSMTEIIEHSDTDEVFWEHIDRVVIDKLKLEFDKRDYTDNGKVVNFEGDEENDKRKNR